MIRGCCIYCGLYFYYYYISSSTDRETLDPTDSGPPIYRSISPLYRQSLLALLICVNFHSMCMFGGDLVAKSCRGLVTPWTVALPGSSVHGILRARILDWVVISFSRGSSRPRKWTQVSRVVSQFSADQAKRERLCKWYWGFLGGVSANEPACQFRRHRTYGFHPWVGKIP